MGKLLYLCALLGEVCDIVGEKHIITQMTLWINGMYAM